MSNAADRLSGTCAEFTVEVSNIEATGDIDKNTVSREMKFMRAH